MSLVKTFSPMGKEFKSADGIMNWIVFGDGKIKWIPKKEDGDNAF